jgi:hypothetical protein
MRETFIAMMLKIALRRTTISAALTKVIAIRSTAPLELFVSSTHGTSRAMASCAPIRIETIVVIQWRIAKPMSRRSDTRSKWQRPRSSVKIRLVHFWTSKDVPNQRADVLQWSVLLDINIGMMQKIPSATTGIAQTWTITNVAAYQACVLRSIVSRFLVAT